MLRLGERLAEKSSPDQRWVVYEVQGLPAGFNAVEVRVYYTTGGYSFISGQDISRGYWLEVQPMGWSRNITMRSAFKGYRLLLQSAKRLSKKQLGLLADQHVYQISDLVQGIANRIDEELN